VLITKNSKAVCNSVPTYGRSPQYIGPSSVSGGAVPHISSMSVCALKGRLNIGDELAVEASYDISKHTPLTNRKGKMLKATGVGVILYSEA
jgi:hypothetical protein